MKDLRDPPYTNVVPPDGYDLLFWIRPLRGVPYVVDLTSMEFDGSAPPGLRQGGANLGGRSLFARRFAESLCRDLPPATTYRSERGSFRTFLRFLYDVDPDGRHQDPDHLTDGLGSALRAWLEAKGSGAYASVRGLVAKLRSDDAGPGLVWPPARQTKPNKHKSISRAAVLALYEAFSDEARQIIDMFSEGSALALAGRDPRVRQDEEAAEPWEERENHAWLARESLRQAASDVLDAEVTFHGPSHAPSYLAPGMAGVREQGAERKLRWCSFGRHDVVVILWLFLLKTGWNLGTALSLDVGSEDRWFATDELSPEHRTLHAYKGRARSFQFSTSLAEPGLSSDIRN